MKDKINTGSMPAPSASGTTTAMAAAWEFTSLEVKKAIMEKTGRGVTHWQGKGAYTEHDKDILFCACNKYEISELRNIVETIDPHAFITLVEGPMIEGGFEKRL